MFTLSIVTPEKVTFDGEVRSLIAPGTEGYLGVHTGHASLITALKPGKIEFQDADDNLHLLAVSRGFLEVSDNVATLLADAVEFAEQIDIERARTAFGRLQEELNIDPAKDPDIDQQAIREGLERAINRIRIYEESH